MEPPTSEESQQRATLPVGSVLRGKYRIDGVLGVGGMAVVYAATHRNTKRFAIKVLHPELAVRRDVKARFVREGYVANSVGHHGVVEVLDDDVAEDGSAFLVMELLEGASLQALLRANGPLAAPVALSIVHQLLGVLAAAHERGIVHRDVKPGNLFLLRDGTLKVLDFGIARLRDATSSLSSTRSGAMMGTPAFMAPEQALAETEDVDARTDIWAVGATLFNLLSGQLIHPGENGRQMVVRTATQPARSLAQVVPDAAEGLVTLVDKALAFDRGARWDSAATMQRALLDAHSELFGSEVLQRLAPLVATFKEQFGSSPTEPSPSDEGSAPLPAATHVGFTRPPERVTAAPPFTPRGLGRWAVVVVTLCIAGMAFWLFRGGAIGRSAQPVNQPRTATATSAAAALPSSAANQVAAASTPAAPSADVPTVSPSLRRGTAQTSRVPKRAAPKPASVAPAVSNTAVGAAPMVVENPLELPIQ